MWVYLESEPGLWVVGFYTPTGYWQPESDHSSKDEAAERVHWLNGGEPTQNITIAEMSNQHVGELIAALKERAVQ